MIFPCSKSILATAGKQYQGHSKTLEHLANCISEEVTVMFMSRIKEGVELIIRTGKKADTKKEKETNTPSQQ